MFQLHLTNGEDWMGLNSEDKCSKTEVVVGLGTKMKTNKTKEKEKQFENVKW